MHTVSVTHTCSMRELTSIFPSDIKCSKKQLFQKLGLVKEQTKAIIYNTNSNPRSELSKSLRKIGFKRVFTYEGNHYSKVYTWMLKIN